ncbi:hypothetical protein BDA96_02G412400 [Sorghum bicolor]|jgi:hypothetical protein|nr:hypothetical protein BDA96_02G412400 [Sorghum bicolor]
MIGARRLSADGRGRRRDGMVPAAGRRSPPPAGLGYLPVWCTWFALFFTAFTFNGSEPDGRALQAKKSSRNLPPLFGFTLGFISSASDALHSLHACALLRPTE